MFTGIVTDMGEVLSVAERAQDLRRVRIACGYERDSIAIGASIACAGICLTVVATGEHGGRTTFSADVAAETLKITNAGSWKPGDRLNLERSLRLGDELGGHLVTGHVDGLATVVGREDLPEMARIVLSVPRSLAPFVAQKGSVALDGVSLTVNTVTDDTFSVLVIPHTLQVTTLGRLAVGDRVHIEIDVMARYAARLMETR
jgi:riboflavin synthase